MADYERMIIASEKYYRHDFVNDHARTGKIFVNIRRQVVKDVVNQLTPGRTFRPAHILQMLQAIEDTVRPPIWPRSQWFNTEGTVQKYLIEMISQGKIEGQQKKLPTMIANGDGSFSEIYRRGWLFRKPPENEKETS